MYKSHTASAFSVRFSQPVHIIPMLEIIKNVFVVLWREQVALTVNLPRYRYQALFCSSLLFLVRAAPPIFVRLTFAKYLRVIFLQTKCILRRKITILCYTEETSPLRHNRGVEGAHFVRHVSWTSPFSELVRPCLAQWAVSVFHLDFRPKCWLRFVRRTNFQQQKAYRLKSI